MKNVINKHKSNKIKENSNTVRHLNNGTDRRHSKSCCDQSSPARRTIKAIVLNIRIEVSRHNIHMEHIQLTLCHMLFKWRQWLDLNYLGHGSKQQTRGFKHKQSGIANGIVVRPYQCKKITNQPISDWQTVRIYYEWQCSGTFRVWCSH